MKDKLGSQNMGCSLEEQLPRSGRHGGFRGANTGQKLLGRSGLPSLPGWEKRRCFASFGSGGWLGKGGRFMSLSQMGFAVLFGFC